MMATPTPAEIVADVVESRSTYVTQYLNRRVNQVEGDFTDGQFDAWYDKAHEMWRRRYPAFAALLPSHLPSTEGSEP